MKTTIELPDPMFKQLKVVVAERGVTLKAFIIDALHEKLTATPPNAPINPPWMRGFGKLSHLKTENARIQKLISQEFDVLEEEDLK